MTKALAKLIKQNKSFARLYAQKLKWVPERPEDEADLSEFYRENDRKRARSRASNR